MERDNWNKLLEKYLIENTMESVEYETLDDYQMFTIQELKKAFKRIKNYDKEL